MIQGPMPISRRQLAASLLAATDIADRHAIAAFIADAATQSASNPFPNTSVGAVRQVWRQRVAEFQSFDVEAVGLSCLLSAVSSMDVEEALVQEIVRAGPHTANVFHRGDGCWIVGAVLYGKPGTGLPVLAKLKHKHPAPSSRSWTRRDAGQLDLFARA